MSQYFFSIKSYILVNFETLVTKYLFNNFFLLRRSEGKKTPYTVHGIITNRTWPKKNTPTKSVISMCNYKRTWYEGVKKNGNIQNACKWKIMKGSGAFVIKFNSGSSPLLSTIQIFCLVQYRLSISY